MFQVFFSCFIFLVTVGALAVVCNSIVLFLFVKHKSVSCLFAYLLQVDIQYKQTQKDFYDTAIPSIQLLLEF